MYKVGQQVKITPVTVLGYKYLTGRITYVNKRNRWALVEWRSPQTDARLREAFKYEDIH